MNAAQRRLLLADQIREAIRRSPRSQREIGEAAGIHESSMSKFMTEQRGLTLAAIERLALALDMQLVEKRKPKKK